MGGSVILTHSAAAWVRVRFEVERVIKLGGWTLRANVEMRRKGRKGEDKRAVERRMAMVYSDLGRCARTEETWRDENESRTLISSEWGH